MDEVAYLASLVFYVIPPKDEAMMEILLVPAARKQAFHVHAYLMFTGLCLFLNVVCAVHCILHQRP
jgi:hypothetical protein